MSQALARSVRIFVAEGSGLPTERVIPGNDKGPRPKDPYASVLLIDDKRRGYPIRRQLEAGQTADLVYRRAVYSVQFYRNGSVEIANKFDQWSQSENGLTQAETAFSDGRLNRIRVLNGGSGYTAATVSFSDGGGSGAVAEAGIVSGAISGISLTNRGSGYALPPTITITGDGSGAVATSVGYGFRTVFPIRIRRLDEITGDAFEERAQIDLGIDYMAALVQDTGIIDTIECAVILSGDEQRGQISLTEE